MGNPTNTTGRASGLRNLRGVQRGRDTSRELALSLRERGIAEGYRSLQRMNGTGSGPELRQGRLTSDRNADNDSTLQLPQTESLLEPSAGYTETIRIPNSGALQVGRWFLVKITFSGGIRRIWPRAETTRGTINFEGRDRNRFSLKIKENLTHEISTSFQFNIDAIIRACRSGSRENLLHVLSGTGIHGKLFGDNFTIGLEIDPDLCFLIIGGQTEVEFPPSPERIKIKGTLNIKIGLTREAWIQIFETIVRRYGPQVAKRTAIFLGRLLGAEFLEAAGIAAIIAVLYYVTMRFLLDRIQAAHQKGLILSMNYQYAEGYVRIAFARNEQDYRYAITAQTPGRDPAEARRLGVQHAREDIDRAGGREIGQIEIRHFLCIQLPPKLNPPRRTLPLYNGPDNRREDLIRQAIELFAIFLEENENYILLRP